MATRGESEQQTQQQISSLADNISYRSIERIALFYLGINDVTLVNLKEENRENLRAYKQSILSYWAERNPGPTQAKVSDICIFLNN